MSRAASSSIFRPEPDKILVMIRERHSWVIYMKIYPPLDHYTLRVFRKPSASLPVTILMDRLMSIPQVGREERPGQDHQLVVLVRLIRPLSEFPCPRSLYLKFICPHSVSRQIFIKSKQCVPHLDSQDKHHRVLQLKKRR
jgi:hypothetical protein